MKIDKTWPLSAAEQLKSQLRLALRTGTWRTGANLPTVRKLAAVLSLNPNTIAAVYRDLAREGLVTHHRRGGTRVAPGLLRRTEEDAELLETADRLIRLAQAQQRTGAELLRLLAGRWHAPGEPNFSDARRHPLYEFLRHHDHDQG